MKFIVTIAAISTYQIEVEAANEEGATAMAFLKSEHGGVTTYEPEAILVEPAERSGD